MDYTVEIEKIKNELMSLGFTEKKYNELTELAAEEVLDIALLDLQKKDENTFNTLDQNLKENISSKEEAENNIQEIFKAAYGEEAENTKVKLVYEYLQGALEQAKNTKDLLQKYQAGDPTAVATINTNKDNPDIQDTTSVDDSF